MTLAQRIVRSGLIGGVGGPTIPLREVLAVAGQMAGSVAQPRAVSAAKLAELGVGAWMGPASLPLWIDYPAWRGFATMNTGRARAAGLSTRPLEETLRSALDYENEREESPDAPARVAGLTDAEERRVRAKL